MMSEASIDASLSEGTVNFGALKPSISSVSIAVAGALSALVTMFVNVQDTLSIKWFLFLIWLSATILILFLKRIDDLEKENRKSFPPPFEKPIKIINGTGIIVIKKNSNFANNIIVGCYLIEDEIEKIAFAARVYHGQEQVLQLKIIGSFCTDEDFRLIEAKGASATLIVRPNIPFDLLEKLGDAE